MKSRLAFSMNSKDSVEDNFLHAFELYNMRLPADLVVLSACETGYGKFESGEGIMSLAHAFTYAGCPSIVMSHWVADDKATAELMQLFYRNLSNGMSKDKALQRAKLDFLKHADVIRENPGFWSAFVVVGNTDPVSIESFDYKFTAYVAAGFGLLMIVGWMIVVKNRRKKLRAAAA
jgi:CHAT domain-containing protein